MVRDLCWGAGVGAGTRVGGAAGLGSLPGTGGQELSRVHHLRQSQGGTDLGGILLTVMPKY